MKNLLDPNVLSQCLNADEKFNGNNFTDVTTGQCSRNRNITFDNKNNLKIVLYEDAMELCNPIGSSRKKHEVVAIYFTVANVNPWFYTKPDNIHLVCLVYERDVKEFVLNLILK